MLKEIIKHLDLESPDEKILLLPYQSNPGIIKRNIALNYEKLSNLKITSYRTFFVEKAAKYFPKMEYISGDRQLWIVHNIISESLQELKYFNRYNDFKYYSNFVFEGNSSLLSELFIELKLNFISFRPWNEFIAKCENKDKWNDISLLFDKYKKYLIGNKLFDYADAVTMLNDKNVRFDGIHIIADKPSRMETELIHKSGMNPIDANPVLNDYELDAFKTDTVNQEAMQVTRLIIQDMKSIKTPVKIGICVSDYNKYYHHFKHLNKKLSENNLFHFIKGAPFFDSQPGALWKYFAEWLANSQSIYRFIILLESGLLNYKNILGDISAPDYYQSIKYFKKCRISLFDKDFSHSFENYINNRQQRDDDEYEKKDKALTEIALKLANSFSEPIIATNPFELLRNMARLLEICSYTNNEQNRIAINKFSNEVESLVSAFESNTHYNYNINELLIILNDSLAGTYIKSSLPDYTIPVVGTDSDLQYFEFDKLYIMGLDEHGLPKKVSQNPLFLDYEKKLLSTSIPDAKFYMAEDELDASNTRFDILKSTVTQKMVLSAPLKDLESGRDKLVSRYFLEEWNRKNNSTLDYKAMFDTLNNNPNSSNNFIANNPAESMYDYEVAVSVISKELENNPVNILLSGNFSFSEFCAKQIDINKTNFDEYWGKLDLDIERDLGTLSASRITAWVYCPYKYFLNYELKLDKMEDHDITNLEWLTNMDAGSFIHDLFHSFIMKLREKYGNTYSEIVEADKSVLDKLFDEHIEYYKEAFSVISELHYSYQKNDLKDISDKFFRNELTNKNKRLYTELSFDMYDNNDRDSILKKCEPAEITLTDKSKILLRGSIDRVDQDTRRYILIDYKTGKPKEFDERKPFSGGALAQAGLYSEIVNQIDPKITEPIFRFYYTSKEGDFKTYELDYKNFRKHFLDLLTAIITEMRRGNFVPTYNYMFCGDCDYYNICAKNKGWLFNIRKDFDQDYKRYKEMVEKEKF